MIRRLEVAAALLMLAMMTVGSPAAAQEAGDPTVDFVVTPSRLEIRVGPDEAIEFPIQVYNRGTEPLRLNTYIQDIDIPDNELVTTDELAFTASRWTTFGQEALVVPGGGSRSVNVRVAIPESTPPGGYHAFAFFQTDAKDAAQNLLPAGRIGVTLLVDVVPEGVVLTREALVDDTSIDVSWHGLFNASVEGTTTIQNIGEAHVMVGGIHTWRSFPTRDPIEDEVGPLTVLRGTRTTLTSGPHDVPFIGKVTLTSEIVYQAGPDELPVILTQTTKWIIPWHLVIGLVVVSAAGVGIYAALRRRRNQMLEETSDSEKEEWENEPSYS